MTELERKLWARARRYVRFLRFVPFLRMVAVCNNLSFSRVNEESDIDLFVIAKSGRLFTVRFFSILILQILGVRLHGNKIRKRFCLSFFVDDSALDLSKIAIHRDIYLAFWIKSLVPILDDGVSSELLDSNNWAREYFERAEDFRLKRERQINDRSVLKRFLSFVLSGRFGDALEKKLLRWQKERANKKAKNIIDEKEASARRECEHPSKGRVASPEGAGSLKTDVSLIIEDHVLKFHHHDRRGDFSAKWTRTYGEDVKLNDERFLSLWR